jgi:hypothetical protein
VSGGVRRIARALLGVAALVSGGCAGFVHPNPPPPADNEWPRTLAAAQDQAGRAEFEAADSLLGRFAREHAGSHGALEAEFWQGVFRLDPSNRTGSMSSGLAALDAYLADPRPHDHASEALTLRRVAAQLDAANRLAASATIAAHEATAPNRSTAESRPDQRSADASADEIKRLKEELAKANAELERIKRRLAQPPGKR